MKNCSVQGEWVSNLSQLLPASGLNLSNKINHVS